MELELNKEIVNTVVGVYFHNKITTDNSIIDNVYPYKSRIPDFENKLCALNLRWSEQIQGWIIIQSVEI